MRGELGIGHQDFVALFERQTKRGQVQTKAGIQTKTNGLLRSADKFGVI